MKNSIAWLNIAVFILVLLQPSCANARTVNTETPLATPQPTEPHFNRDWGIQQALEYAKHPSGHIVIIESRIDSVNAELVTPAEASERIGGTDDWGTSNLLWYVTVNGCFLFRVEFLNTPTPFSQVNQRYFIFDSESGQLRAEGHRNAIDVGTIVPRPFCASAPGSFPTIRQTTPYP